jgi:hypothetical protein
MTTQGRFFGMPDFISTEVHEEADRGDRALSAVHEPDELPEGGPPPEVDAARDRRMVVVRLADLDEVDPALEVPDHLLVALGRPPLDRVVPLAARSEQPIGPGNAPRLLHPVEPLPFLGREVHIPTVVGGLNPEPQLVVQVLDEAEEEVVGRGVALVDDGVVTVDHSNSRLALVELGEPWVPDPQIGAGGPDVGGEASRVAAVEVPDRRGQHDNVARGLRVAQDQPFRSRHSGQDKRAGAPASSPRGDEREARRLVR